MSRSTSFQGRVWSRCFWLLSALPEVSKRAAKAGRASSPSFRADVPATARGGVNLFP